MKYTTVAIAPVANIHFENRPGTGRPVAVRSAKKSRSPEESGPVRAQPGGGLGAIDRLPCAGKVNHGGQLAGGRVNFEDCAFSAGAAGCCRPPEKAGSVVDEIPVRILAGHHSGRIIRGFEFREGSHRAGADLDFKMLPVPAPPPATVLPQRNPTPSFTSVPDGAAPGAGPLTPVKSTTVVMVPVSG